MKSASMMIAEEIEAKARALSREWCAARSPAIPEDGREDGWRDFVPFARDPELFGMAKAGFAGWFCSHAESLMEYPEAWAMWLRTAESLRRAGFGNRVPAPKPNSKLHLAVKAMLDLLRGADSDAWIRMWPAGTDPAVKAFIELSEMLDRDIALLRNEITGTEEKARR